MDKIENQISYDIRRAIFKVYNNLGPVLFESVYETALSYEIEKLGYSVKRQVALPFVYEEIKFEQGFRIDILVDDKVIIELKSVETIAPVHPKQLLTYLKLTDLKLGLLVNFNEKLIKDGITRIVNKL